MAVPLGARCGSALGCSAATAAATRRASSPIANDGGFSRLPFRKQMPKLIGALLHGR